MHSYESIIVTSIRNLDSDVAENVNVFNRETSTRFLAESVAPASVIPRDDAKMPERERIFTDHARSYYHSEQIVIHFCRPTVSVGHLGICERQHSRQLP